MNNSLQDLLRSSVESDALREADQSLLDPTDAIMEALEEATALPDEYEIPVNAGIDHMQALNQDHMDGIDGEDFENLNPDNKLGESFGSTDSILADLLRPNSLSESGEVVEGGDEDYEDDDISDDDADSMADDLEDFDDEDF